MAMELSARKHASGPLSAIPLARDRTRTAQPTVSVGRLCNFRATGLSALRIWYIVPKVLYAGGGSAMSAHVSAVCVRLLAVPAMALAALAVQTTCLAADIPLSGPGVLDRDGGTYYLTQNVTAPGTAFVVTAKGVKLDLRGYTVTYNTSASASPVYGVRVGTSTQWVNLDSRGLRITNGNIVQGSGKSQYAHAIYLKECSPRNVEISYLGISVHGGDCKAIEISTGAAYTLNIHHNTVTSTIGSITNRHALDGYAIYLVNPRESTIHDNTIVGGHGGIALITSKQCSVYNNDISHNALHTNGYGINTWNPQDLAVYQNHVHTNNGCGIGAGDWYRNVSIYDNTVTVKMGWTPEYGYSLTAWGMKFRTYPDSSVDGLAPGNLRVYGNTITASTGPGLVDSAGGIGILDCHADLNNEYFSNDIRVSTTDSTKVAAGMRFAGVPAPAAGTKIYDNLITSNDINIDFSTSDGRGTDNVELVSNTLVKGSGGSNYHTVNMGYWKYASQGHTFTDTRTQNGASVHDVELDGGEGGSSYSLSVSWYLDVTVTDEVGNPLAGVALVASAQSGPETVVRVTDAQGTARLPLTQYYRYGTTSPPTSIYDYSTPHTITVSKDGYVGSSQEVTVDASKALVVPLSPGAGDPPALSLQKTSARTEAAPGEVVTYTIVFANQSAVALSSVVIIDPLPSEVTYIGGSTRLNGQVVTPDPYANGQIWVTVGFLAAGGQGTITFQAAVN